MKEIIQKGDNILRQVAPEVPIEEITSPKIQTLLTEMKETLSHEGDGVALAAPQIGTSLRIFIISPAAYSSISEEPLENYIFINPKITKKSFDKKSMEEGCLSVRGWYGKVKRASRVTIKALNENGEEFEIKSTGVLAQAFQHEIDHLDGILFTDSAKDLIQLTPDEYEQ
jgi:peptide deformylase